MPCDMVHRFVNSWQISTRLFDLSKFNPFAFLSLIVRVPISQSLYLARIFGRIVPLPCPVAPFLAKTAYCYSRLFYFIPHTIIIIIDIIINCRLNSRQYEVEIFFAAEYCDKG